MVAVPEIDVVLHVALCSPLIWPIITIWLFFICRFSEDGMDVMERFIYLFRKFHQLKVSNEEYACMKAINFLNQGAVLAIVCKHGIKIDIVIYWNVSLVTISMSWCLLSSVIRYIILIIVK